ncbi:MAG: hypothetical protein FD174_888 [Geobacteraceae bacterium]|nr:MAG: hypothetical protein FD174_888 [Geobacteraceae bacterium]
MISGKIVSALFISAFSILFAGILQAASLDKIQFIKIAPQDAKAVIKGADGKLHVIKQGDVIEEVLTVKEIAQGRIVLEEKTEKGPETVIVRMLNGKAKIERLRKQPDSRPALVAPGR